MEAFISKERVRHPMLYHFEGKRKLPERQSSEQMVKRQISRNEQLGHGVPEKGKLETLAVNIEESDVTKLDTSEQGREEAIVDTTG